MYLRRLKLANFKNYTDSDVEFCDNVNCLVGNNGVGKTNLLDAIYYLSFCKSYFNPIDSQNIHQGEEFFAIHGTYNDETLISCILKKGQNKQLKFNHKLVKTFAEHIGKVPLVLVSPTDQQLIQGGSEVRRKFIDGVISQTDKDYLQHLLHYQKSLDQRNRLLKQMAEDHYCDEDMLSLWDDQMAIHGEFICQRRRSFLQEFKPLFNDYYNWIVNDGDEAKVIYDTQLNEISDNFVALLKANRSKDLHAQYTTVGAHKDDIDLLINDMSVKRFGSQGQQKTIALALKLAQFEYILNKCGQKPILLLDDIFDKLDMCRVRQLVQLVASDRFGQVFITDTQPGRVAQIFAEIPQVEHLIYEVDKQQILKKIE